MDPGATPGHMSSARATQLPLHHGDLEEGRPHKIIINKKKISEGRAITFYRNTDTEGDS